MRTTRKRVPVPFLFRADDALGANGKLVARVYGSEVEGVFTRADAAWNDTNGGNYYRLARAAHSQPRLGQAVAPKSLDATALTDRPALTLEAGTTNLVTQSEDFSAWTNSNVTVSTNAVVAPDGTTTADLLDATSATTDERYTAVTFTGDGTKAVSVFLRFNTSTEATVILRDATAGANRVRATVSSTGSVSRIEGTGPVWSVPYVDPSGNAWVRVMLSVDSVVAANTNRVTIRPDTALGTGSVWAWGAQAEDTAIPSSYVKTTGSTVARAVDVLYFPFTLKPQEMTVYVKGVERAFPSVAASSNRFYVSFGNEATPFATLFQQSGTTGYIMYHNPAVQTATATGTLGTAAVPGSVVELRGVLGATGTCTLGVTVDGGAESTNGPSPAQTLGAAWNTSRLYLHSSESGNNPVNFAYTHVCIALGTKTMAEMRALAEVG